MPPYPELNDAQLLGLRHYIRQQAELGILAARASKR
jgi:hypothetical protein